MSRRRGGLWRSLLSAFSGAPEPFVHRHDVAAQQGLQQAAARAAFLSDKPDAGAKGLASKILGAFH
ncbi:MAG: hypothetical protein ACK41C_10305 [Phenylobacterium sp.]|uniref:hypothetical protein n=1 Tax=Phenylobacterium sp. TaxID=1871053 RepID=UPI003918EFD9